MVHRNECSECGRKWPAFFRSALCMFCTEGKGMKYPIIIS